MTTREVESLARGVPSARRRSLSSLSEALAESALDQSRASAARSLIAPLDDLVAYALSLSALRPDVLTLVGAFGIPAHCVGPLADPEYWRAPASCSARLARDRSRLAAAHSGRIRQAMGVRLAWGEIGLNYGEKLAHAAACQTQADGGPDSL